MADARLAVTPRLVFGVCLALLGTLLTLDNLELVDAGQYLRLWPAILLAWGVCRLTGFGCERRPVAGIVLSFVGGWLLLRRLGLVPWDLLEFWPVVLIVLGVALVLGSMARPRSPRTGDSTDSVLHAFAFWSSVKRTVTSKDFRGGDIAAIMGGQEIDLRQAKIAGGSASLDLFVWWGGVEIQVPENWTVSVEPVAVLGGVESLARAPAGAAEGHLILKGLVIMGGVEIKN